MPARSAALYPACCWKRLLRVTDPLALDAALELPPAALLELLELPPQAANHMATPALVVVVIKPRRVVRVCSGRIQVSSTQSCRLL